jgi:predicted  nucleic acid-binding Zn-ribbon protein
MSSEASSTTETLRTLHRIHEQLRDLRERAGRGPRMAKAREANVARLLTQLTEAQGKTKDLRVKTDEKQLQLKSGEAAIERRRQQQREAKDNREYQALVDQIKADQMTNSVLEDEILESMEKLDQHIAKVKQAEQELAKARDDAAAGDRQWEQEAPLIQGDIQRLEAEVQQTEQSLPEDFRELYRRLVRAKGEDALCPIRGEFCAGCNQHVPLNMVAGVMLGKPVCCKSCGRLLYVQEDRSAGKETEGNTQ